jgi:hypothetical protein
MQPNARPSDSRVKFWRDRTIWPDDSPTHVFLGRVVLHIGELLFGTEWTGREPAVELETPLPEILDVSIGQSELLRGCRLLFDHDPDYRARCSPLAELLLLWPMPTDGEWVRAVTFSRRLTEQSQQEFERFLDVCLRLARNFKDGKILTATRDFDGGLERPQDRSFWYTENFWWRFYTCQVDPAGPYRAAVIPQGGALIFVERGSLATALRPKPELEPKAPQLAFSQEEYLSPYIRCMVETTRALRITAQDPRKKDEIIEALPKHWSGAAGDLTNADVERMATFLREPVHKKGRGRKRQ